MAKLIEIKCPKCSAPVSISADATTVICRYCGGTSMIERGHTVAPHAAPQAPTPVPRAAPLFAAIGVSLAVAGISGSVMFFRIRDVDPAYHPAIAGASAPWGAASLHFNDRPMLADVDGDGALDLVGKARGGDMGEVLVALSGNDGKELWRSAALTKDALEGGSRRGVLLGKFVSVDTLGKVQAYDLKNGTPSWSALLGEQAADICDGNGTIVIKTTDDALHGLDPATGKKVELAAKAPACTPVFTSERDVAPGYRIVDWTQMEELGLPDMNDVDGLTAHRALVPSGPGPRFMLGQRAKGSAVAMVAAVDAHKKVLWKDIVPGVDPLTTDVNVLSIEAAVEGDRLLVPYSLKDSDAGSRVACFSIATGERLWDVQALQKHNNSHGIAVTPERVFVTAWFGPTIALSLKTGELQYTIGE